MDEPFPEARRLRRIADYQFGAGAGRALFDAGISSMTRTQSGRPNQVHGPTGRLVTFGTDGRFTLGIAGGRRLFEALEYPAYRVVVGQESDPFVRAGKNAFAKFVREADPAIRAGDEVLVVRLCNDGSVGDPEGSDRSSDDDGPTIQRSTATGATERLLAVGRAELDAGSMLDFGSGVAVKVRDGVLDAVE